MATVYYDRVLSNASAPSSVIKIQVAVGDLPVFTQLLGDGRTPYKGPAGIVGLDILSQRRLILETSSTRQRRIYVGKIG